MKKSLERSQRKTRNKQAFEALLEYAESFGFEVDLNGEESVVTWVPGKKGALNKPHIIDLESGLKLEKRVFTLAHEIGHHELRRRWSKYKKKYPATVETDASGVDAGHSKNPPKVKLQVLEEELDAWRAGWQLIELLELPVDKDRYHKYARECIKTYMDWL